MRRSNRVALGAATGLGGHLLRDLATGKTAVPLLWPLTRRPFSVRYRKYAAVMAVLVAVGEARRARGRRYGRIPASGLPWSPARDSHPSTQGTTRAARRAGPAKG
jgi:hypothetical protein